MGYLQAKHNLRLVFDPSYPDIDETKFMDSDWTGFLILVNNAIVDWVSKKQPTIEFSVFIVDFVAMKHGMEKLRGQRY